MDKKKDPSGWNSNFVVEHGAKLQIPMYEQQNGSKASIRPGGDGSCVVENKKIQV